ncbi:helix-turn-helix domain-containing protein [Pseudooceanicola nitratireducens]|nr:helix-turn-helix transcriptional regulator [Pseudooceanicola nitratireducens]MEC7297270.1 helix-turn-helix transcriptional regulator [Pseudomonadota bacterium]MEC7792488.1 helix-turn-helix transcriptional regulator [Pseudomonadota bacterium]
MSRAANINRQVPMDPAGIRNIFGANLRQLSSQYPSIAGLCRELGINRTQYNRYLSGESFPRPDVLHRICEFFNKDARILLEPVDAIPDGNSELLNHPSIREFLGQNSTNVPEETVPSGLYRFSRRSFVDDTVAMMGMLLVFREDGYTFLRGYEAKDAMEQQGLPTTGPAREFRGIFLLQEEGVANIAARRGSITCSYQFLSRYPSMDGHFLEGYSARSVRETIRSRRVERTVYEHLGTNLSAIRHTARNGGLIPFDQLPKFHQRLLRLDEPFR